MYSLLGCQPAKQDSVKHRQKRFETCIETASEHAGTALKLPTWHVSARGAPSSCQDAGLVVVGRQEAQQGASEISKLLAAVLGKNALSNGLQGNVPGHP